MKKVVGHYGDSSIERRGEYPLLGFGCMRLPKDFELSKSLVLKALDQGVNYFDTAYMYPGNEELLGRILHESGRRDEAIIATKIHSFQLKSPEDFEKRFIQQLERLQTNRIDNYLMHMLPDQKVWNRLQGLGIEDWFSQKKKAGLIGRIGFSFHGKSDTFIEVLNLYPWDFAMVQYNYMDEFTQAGKTGVQAAYAKGIDIIVMEPMRGGTLVNGLSPQVQKMFRATGKSPAAWSLRWLFSQPEVTCVLSGMNTLEMLEENIAIASEYDPFSSEDEIFIERVRETMSAENKIPCTGCSYCMPCPRGVNIPGSLLSYNESYQNGYFKGFSDYMMHTTLRAERSNAGLCNQCGICKSKCPQSIDIPHQIQTVRKRFETPLYGIATLITKSLYKAD